MATYNFRTEDTAENFEEKTLCVFVLDVSGSMEIQDRIGQLNRGIAQFLHDIRNDAKTNTRLEVGIVTFSNEALIHTPPQLANQIPTPLFQAGGLTNLVDGVRLAIKMVENRKAHYKDCIPYKRPFIVLLTDGAPFPLGQDIDGLAQEILAGEEGSHFVFLPIGFADVDMQILHRISVRHPKRLDETKFSEFFDWLGNSMKAVSTKTAGDHVQIPPTNTWETFEL